MLKDWDLLEISRTMEKHKTKPIDKDMYVIKYRHDYLLIWEKEEAFYVIATGTNWSVREWVSNICAIPFRGFHRGFYKTARGMYKRCKGIFANTTKPVKFIGYSRGVYANILAYLLVKDNVISADQVKAVTYGAPEWIKRRGCRKMDRLSALNKEMEFIHIHTAHDIVPLFGLSRHWYTSQLELPHVRGRFDHCAYPEAIKKS